MKKSESGCVGIVQDNKPEDLRIRRTRLLLQQSFSQLMVKKPFQSITVQEITDRAMVHRATFYDHFVDKYELLEYALREHFKEMLQKKLPQEFHCRVDNLDLLVTTTCEFLRFLTGQCVARDKQIMEMVQTQITAQIQEIIMTWMRQIEFKTSAPLELTATISSWAIYGTALYWSRIPALTSIADFVRDARPGILATLGPVVQEASL